MKLRYFGPLCDLVHNKERVTRVTHLKRVMVMPQQITFMDDGFAASILP